MIKFKSLVLQLFLLGMLLGASQVSFAQGSVTTERSAVQLSSCEKYSFNTCDSDMAATCSSYKTNARRDCTVGSSGNVHTAFGGECPSTHSVSGVSLTFQSAAVTPTGPRSAVLSCTYQTPPPPPCPDGETCCPPHLQGESCECPNPGTQVNTGMVCENTCPFGSDDSGVLPGEGMCYTEDCPFGDGPPGACNDRTCSNEGHKSVEMLPGMWMCVKDIPDDSSSSSSAGGDDDNGNGDGGDGGSNSSTDGGQNNSSTSSVASASSASSSSGNGGGGSGSSTSNAGSSASGGAGSSAGNGQGDCPAGQVQQGTVNGNPVCAGQCPSGQSWGSVNDVWGCYGSGSSGSSASSCPAGQECNGDGGTGEWPEPGGFCEEGEECNSLTMEQVLGDFMEGITSADIVNSMDEFLTIDGGGSCPVWNVSAWVFVLTVDQFCSPHIPWALIRGVILFIASVIAYRIAFT